MAATPIRTLLVHDRIPANQPVFEAVQRHDALALVGTVWTVERLEQALRLQAPELLLLDWTLAGASASDVCRLAKVRLLAPKVIAVVSDEGQVHRHAVALAGADAMMNKRAAETSLERALSVVFPERFGRHGA